MPVRTRIAAISEGLLKMTLRKYKHVVLWEDYAWEDEELE